MRLFFKRLGAYLIDIVIVTLIATIISNISLFNYQLDKYQEAYDNYLSTYSDFKDNKITEKEYNKKIEKIKYQLDKNSVNTTIISIACLIGYFAIFQYSQNGKTIGKRILKLQTVKVKEKDLNIGNYLLRSLILNNILFSIANIICVSYLSQKNYTSYTNIATNIEFIVEILILLSMLISRDGRGIHDYIAGSKVIDLKEVDEFEMGTKKKIIEGEIIK